ncbi:flagellar assembly protein FliW [Alkalicoccus luteus]|uniref:Flagellar assembly factor FliW n=1 Tax=Alkalicoccus luteus TaxID=1237094 RepID=A0A969TUK3_9BACI|nr:flagellar assembly protein FliW [Alkalicoccus luteus]NJP37056.1 flagellar assembly protein FliW [Alkalicoccus luteus]
MQIETKYSGTVDINEANITVFPSGIPSFEAEKQFVLLPFAEETGPFYILQSVATAELAFIVMNPFTFFPDYEVELSDQTLEALHVSAEEDVSLFVMLTLKDSWQDSSANLRGPIVINHETRLGRQIVLAESSYSTKHALPVPAKEGK